MKRKKGFTLIELLAVIVILAIIALIATPIILNMINDAKKSAAKDSAYGYIEAIEYNNSMASLELDNGYTKIEGTDLDVTGLDVKVKGTLPTKGNITITNGRVTEADLCINNYNVSYNGKEATVTGSCGDNGSNKDEEVVLEGDPILDKAKALVYENDTCKTDGTTYNYMGGCYIKETSSNNYVWYNGFMWRIMGINSDNTVRLITDENVTAIPYGAINHPVENYKDNKDYINDWLNDYFYGKLNSTKSIIKEGNYFCSETIEAALTDDTVRTECTSGKEVNASVGLISYDEYYLSGKILADKFSSYLNIGQYFWTMTPNGTFNAWSVAYNGFANNSGVGFTNGVRPVINVDATSIITKGDGTALGYFVLSENKNNDKTGTLGEKATSGEYVKLEEKTYRVVSKESDGIKLILDGYYEEIAGTPYNMKFGSDNTFTTTSGIGATLNGAVLTSLGLSTSDKIVETTWYQGDGIEWGFKYTDVLNSTNNGVPAKVGLIRVGEMLSGQSSTLFTKNYTTPSSYINATTYWTMTPNGTFNAWSVNPAGSASNDGVTYTFGVRPVIKVKTNLNISKGNGTWDSPYEI